MKTYPNKNATTDQEKRFRAGYAAARAGNPLPGQDSAYAHAIRYGIRDRRSEAPPEEVETAVKAWRLEAIE